MSLRGDQKLADGSLVAVGGGQPEGRHHTCGADREANLEPIHPLGFGHATAESRLTGEQALPARPDAHDRRDERRVDHPVDLRAVGERGSQFPLQGSQVCFEGACGAVELDLADEARQYSAV